jgi:serine phosphatase RsbU (regulator of sigma subunit)
MLGDSYLNQIIKLQGIIDPQEILNHLHHHIGVALNQEETLNQDGMDIAICVIDPERKVMEFAGAGRPILIIQDGKMEVLESCKLPVGGFQRDRERVFNKLSFDLQKPTAFYVFSDGFQDQFGGSKGRKFAKSRLEELLFELHPKPMKEQKKLLNKTLVEWMNENRQMDDILIIGVKLHY